MPRPSWPWFGLNAIRLAGCVAIIWLAVVQVVLFRLDVTEIKAVHVNAGDLYRGHSTVPNQPGGAFFMVVSRLAWLAFLSLLFLGQLGLPETWLHENVPWLGPGSSPLYLGLCELGLSVESQRHRIGPTHLIPAWILLGLGFVNISLAVALWALARRLPPHPPPAIIFNFTQRLLFFRPPPQVYAVLLPDSVHSTSVSDGLNPADEQLWKEQYPTFSGRDLADPEAQIPVAEIEQREDGTVIHRQVPKRYKRKEVKGRPASPQLHAMPSGTFRPSKQPQDSPQIFASVERQDDNRGDGQDVRRSKRFKFETHAPDPSPSVPGKRPQGAALLWPGPPGHQASTSASTPDAVALETLDCDTPRPSSSQKLTPCSGTAKLRGDFQPKERERVKHSGGDDLQPGLRSRKPAPKIAAREPSERRDTEGLFLPEERRIPFLRRKSRRRTMTDPGTAPAGRTQHICPVPETVPSSSDYGKPPIRSSMAPKRSNSGSSDHARSAPAHRSVRFDILPKENQKGSDEALPGTADGVSNSESRDISLAMSDHADSSAYSGIESSSASTFSSISPPLTAIPLPMIARASSNDIDPEMLNDGSIPKARTQQFALKLPARRDPSTKRSSQASSHGTSKPWITSARDTEVALRSAPLHGSDGQDTHASSRRPSAASTSSTVSGLSDLTFLSTGSSSTMPRRASSLTLGSSSAKEVGGFWAQARRLTALPL